MKKRNIAILIIIVVIAIAVVSVVIFHRNKNITEKSENETIHTELKIRKNVCMIKEKKTAKKQNQP